jgi:hypothetical protein
MSSLLVRTAQRAAGDPRALTTQYEAARALAVGDPSPGQPVVGLTVLYRWGLPAWMHVVGSAAQPLAALCDPRPLPSMPEQASSDTAATVLVLASMLLASSMESNPCTPRSN